LPPKPKKRLKAEDRRAGIVDAALRLFSEKGFAGTRTKEIARSAGISEALIFRHFKSKEELYNEALRTTLKDHPIIPDIIGRIEEKDDYGVLFAYAAHMVEHGLADERMFRLILYSGLEGVRLDEHSAHPPKGDPEDVGWEPADVALVRYFQDRIEDGVFKDIDPRVAVRLFRNSVSMYVADHILKIDPAPFPVPHREALDILVRIFLGGLKDQQK
jgi:TetR/AcrR family transcriptional regulator